MPSTSTVRVTITADARRYAHAIRNLRKAERHHRRVLADYRKRLRHVRHQPRPLPIPGHEYARRRRNR